MRCPYILRNGPAENGAAGPFLGTPISRLAVLPMPLRRAAFPGLLNRVLGGMMGRQEIPYGRGMPRPYQTFFGRYLR